MTESVHSLAALRRHIAALDGAALGAPSRTRFATGQPMLDTALGGGLAHGCVHELFADVAEEGAGAGMALMLAGLAGGMAPLLWLRTAASGRAGGLPYGPGLAAMGLDPSRLLIGVMPDDAMLLRAAVEALRCMALGALILELRGRAPLLDLTASRRLTLAAEASGVTGFVLRIGGDPVPSAAETRWQVSAAASTPLPGNAPGQSSFALHLLRRRAGPDGMAWQLVWDKERGIFGERQDERHDAGAVRGTGPGAALSGAVVPLSGAGPAAGRAA